MVYQALEIATEAERAGQEEMAAKRVLDKAAVKVRRGAGGGVSARCGWSAGGFRRFLVPTVQCGHLLHCCGLTTASAHP